MGKNQLAPPGVCQKIAWCLLAALTDYQVTEQTKNSKRRQAWTLEGFIYPCQTNLSEDSPTPVFLPKSEVYKSSQDAHPGRNWDVLWHREQKSKGSAGTPLEFRGRKMAPRARDICDRSQSGTDKGSRSKASAVASHTPSTWWPLPNSTSIISLGAGGWSQHP